MKFEKIDVLIGTHNGEMYLAEQLKSILNQSYQNVKIIVRDDGSQDNTRMILSEYKTKYPEKFSILLNNKPPFGTIQNYSALIEHSTAPYIMLADQDDIWLSNKIERSIRAMISMEEQFSHPSPILIHSDMKVVNQKLENISQSFWDYAGLSPENLSINRLLVQNVVTGCTTIFNRSLADVVCPIPTCATMHDHWIALVASTIGKIGLLNESTMLYRQHERNVLGAKQWTWNIQEILKKGMKFLFGRDREPVFSEFYAQAGLLMNRTRESISEDKKEILNTFLQLNEMPYFRKKKTILKYGFLKGKWPQNIGLLLRG